MVKPEKLTEELKKRIYSWKNKEGNLIMIFHEVQDHFGYVPRSIAMEISEILGVKLARIYEVLTFYHYFKLEPPGKYIISVCIGTACYLKGATELMEELENILDVKEGEPTKDRLFQYEGVRCIGCCGVAPALSINGEVYTNLTKSDISELINKYYKLERVHMKTH